MKPVKLLLACAALCSTIFVANAQDKELGLFLGTAQYQGDLSKKDITLNETQPAFGALMRYYFNPRINLKVGVNYGWIEGDDANYGSLNDNTEDRARFIRNLSFRSHVLELSAQAELNILPYISNSKRYRFSPFIFAGVAGYHFNPKAELDGKWYALQPLGTEGQTLNGKDEKYSLIQFSVPYGVGIKYSLGNFWNIALEVGQRKLFTDYLDDVSDKYADYNALAAEQGPEAARLSDRSREILDPANVKNRGGLQRGDPKDLDMYVFAGFTITKTIRRFSCTNF